MPRNRKVVSLSDSEGSANRNIALEYTFDEDSEVQVHTRRCINISTIRTRSRALLYQDASTNDLAMSEPGNQPGMSQQSINATSADGIADITSRLENVFLNEFSALRQILAESLSANRNRSGGNENLNGGNREPSSNNDRSFNESWNNSRTDSRAPNTTVKVDKWNISYDRNEDVSDFLFKVDTLAKRSKCSDETLIASFHILLKGKAETWFWAYLRQAPNTSLNEVKRAMRKQFGRAENECDKILRIIERRQLPKESFDDFFTEVIAMNSRLSQPMSDMKMIDLIKNNVKDSVGSLLFMDDSIDLDSLRDAGRRAERYVIRQNQQRSRRFVSEIEENNGAENNLENNHEVEAFKFHKNLNHVKNNIDTSRFKCWNCDQVGHSFYDCPSKERKLFCYRCGEKNVTTPQCPKRHQENKQANE